MFPILIRTTVIYFVLILFIRLTGKRQVGEMELSELITAFLISEVASAPLTDGDLPLLYAILPILLLSSLEILVSFLTVKCRPIRRLMEPSPTVLIRNGIPDRAALSRQRMTLDELISALRLKNASDIASVRLCFLEHNSQLSVFQGTEAVILPVLSDGVILRENLTLLGRDEIWLTEKLREDGRTSDRLFLIMSDGKTLFCVEKKPKSGGSPS